MRIRIWSTSLLALVVLVGAGIAGAQALVPRIFFTDLTSGPNTGGENNNGTILTIYGKNFGATQGSSTVTIGGAPVAAYLQWGAASIGETGLQKISVAIGKNVATGAVVVQTTTGMSNSDVTFTVRSGNIYCVATTGNDSNSGAFPNSCWKTIPQAAHSISPGDIAYVENGVSQLTEDTYSAYVSLMKAGTQSNPLAIVVYPGATATVGNGGVGYGFRLPAISGGPFNWWVIAGFNISAAYTGISVPYATGSRIIANDVTCNTTSATGNAACLTADSASTTWLYGNNIHDVGYSGSTKTYHAVYWSVDTNHDQMAWNTIKNVLGCRGIQFYTYTGSDMYDIHVHDNVIHNVRCDGINFSTVDPTKGTVEAYNNIIYHVGTGPDPVDGQANYACVNVNTVGGYTGAFVEIYNNTMYDCGGRNLSGNSGAVTPAAPARVRNNIVYLTSGETWTAYCSNTTGTNNLGPTASNCSSLTAGITTDPLLQNLSGNDFHLTASSPAIGAGVNIPGLTYDFAGLPRPGSAAFDIGAYQYANIRLPAPPSGLTVTVN